MASLLTPCQPRRLACWWVMWIQLPSVGAGQVLADLDQPAAPCRVARSRRCSASQRAGRIINHRPRHQCRHHPDLRPAAAEDHQATSYSCLPNSPEQAVALILQGAGERIPRALRLDPNRPGAGAVARWRAWLWLPLTQHRAARAASTPDPTDRWALRLAFLAPADKVDAGGKRLTRRRYSTRCGTWKQSMPMAAN